MAAKAPTPLQALAQRREFRVVVPIIGAVLIVGGSLLVLAAPSGSNPTAPPSSPTQGPLPIGGPGVTEIAVGGAPVAVAAGENAVWALRRAPGGDVALVEIDPSLASVAAGPYDVPDGAAYLAVGEGGVWVLVRPEGGQAASPGPSGSPSGAAPSGAGSVVRIDPATGDVVATIPVGTDPRAIIVAQGSVWVADGDGKTVERLSPATNDVLASLPVDNAPNALVGGSSGLWVVTGDAPSTTVRFSVELQSVAATFPSTAVNALGPRYVWAVFGDGLGRLDPKINEPLEGRYELSSPDASVCVLNSAVWVGEMGTVRTGGDEAPQPAFQVFRLNPGPFTPLTESVVVNDAPTPVVCGEGGLWVASTAAGAVLRIDPAAVPPVQGSSSPSASPSST
jgi:YVTN family beta-propeller protein